MINMAASSGASINQVLERCGKEIRGPLGQELGLICRRLNLGETPETVFMMRMSGSIIQNLFLSDNNTA